MNNRFVLALITVVVIATAVFGSLHLLGGGAFSSTVAYLSLGALMALSIVFKLRKYWVGLLLLGNLWVNSVDMPLLDNFTCGVILQAGLIALAWAERIISKQRMDLRITLGDRAMLVVAFIMLAQLIVEHPGSARLGGAGGLGQMIYYVFAGWYFWGAFTLARDNWDEQVAMRWLFWASVVFSVATIGRRILTGVERPFFGLFWTVGFPMFAWLLAKVMQRWIARRGTIVAVMAAILVVLAASIYSPYRACPFIALLMIVSVAIIFRLRLGFWCLIVTMLAGALLIARSLPESTIPESARRTLSTLRPIDTAQMMNREPGEYGWEFSFRADLWNRAKADIRMHPFVGAGWVFSFDEIIAAVAHGGAEGIKSSNALSGGYHNGLLAMAAKSGLPVALAFSFGYLFLLLRFLRRIPKDATSRMLSAVLVGTLMGETVVFLTNGGGQQSVRLAVFLAVMSACTQRWAARQAAAAEAESPAPAPAMAITPFARPRNAYVVR